MRQRLIQYVELLFAGAPDAEEMKQEILQNTLDRYDDLVSQGKTEEAAYRLAISGIGDINELLDSHARPSHIPLQQSPYAWPAAEKNTKKKSNTFLRILLIGLAVFILGSLLFSILGIGIFSMYFSDREFEEHTQVIESGSTQISETDLSGITGIEIDWAAGDIRIEPSENVTAIQVRETEVEDKYKMLFNVSGDTLIIQFCKESIKFPSFGVDTVPKDLIITVPSDWVCETLELDVAAANVIIKDLTIGQLDFDGASGFCSLENCQVTNVDVDAASGDLSFSGSIDTLDFDGASADCTLVLTNCPSHIDLDGMSGELDITLPSDCGFTARTSGLSCDFITDFQTTFQDGTHRHGDGHCLIEIDALSGKVNIHDGGYNCHEDNNPQHHSKHH